MARPPSGVVSFSWSRPRSGAGPGDDGPAYPRRLRLDPSVNSCQGVGGQAPAPIRACRGRPAMRDLGKYLEAQPRGMSVAAVAEEEPGRPAVVSPHGDRSFGELNARANQLARALKARGLEQGDGVALLCTNRAEFVEAYAATHRAGLRLTCINWHLTAEESGYIAADCDAKALIADSRLADLALGTAHRAPGATVRLAIGGEIQGFDGYEAVAGEQD